MTKQGSLIIRGLAVLSSGVAALATMPKVAQAADCNVCFTVCPQDPVAFCASIPCSSTHVDCSNTECDGHTYTIKCKVNAE